MSGGCVSEAVQQILCLDMRLDTLPPQEDCASALLWPPPPYDFPPQLHYDRFKIHHKVCM
jgi:hypothetical protein